MHRVLLCKQGHPSTPAQACPANAAPPCCPCAHAPQALQMLLRHAPTCVLAPGLLCPCTSQVPMPLVAPPSAPHVGHYPLPTLQWGDLCARSTWCSKGMGTSVEGAANGCGNGGRSTNTTLVGHNIGSRSSSKCNSIRESMSIRNQRRRSVGETISRCTVCPTRLPSRGCKSAIEKKRRTR